MPLSHIRWRHGNGYMPSRVVKTHANGDASVVAFTVACQGDEVVADYQGKVYRLRASEITPDPTPREAWRVPAPWQVRS